MKKRAQFYLIAALIIIIIIASLGAVFIKINQQKKDTKIYDLSNEINYEANQVINNGIYEGRTSEQIGEDLKTLTAYYAKENQDSDIAVLYGDESEIKFIVYEAEDCVNLSPPLSPPTNNLILVIKKEILSVLAKLSPEEVEIERVCLNPEGTISSEIESEGRKILEGTAQISSDPDGKKVDEKILFP